MTAPQQSPPRASFLGRSVSLNALFVSEGVFNFLLDAVLAASVGLGPQSDSLYAAWSLPLTIGRGMFQSLTNSFMGIFAEESELGQVYNQAISVIVVTGFALAFLMSVTTVWWFPLTVPGASTETQATGLPLAVLLAWLIGFLALAETCRAIYYKEENFRFPSISRLIGTLLTISVVYWAGQRQDLTLVAWGIVMGAALEALLGVAGLRFSLGLRYRFTWPEKQELREMVRVVGMPLAGQGVRVLAGVLERAISSLLGPGTLTAVAFANRIIQTTERFIFRGFVVTTVQTYTAKARSNLSANLRLIFLIALPLSIVFLVLPEPLVTVAFGRGRFTAEDIQVLSIVLQAYAPAILAIALSRIPFGVAYAQKLGRVVFGYFLAISLSLVLMDLLLIWLGFGQRAFGIAFTASQVVAFVWLYRTVAMDDGRLWSRADTLQMAAVGLIAFVGTVLTSSIVSFLTANNQWTHWLTLIAGSVTSVLLVLAAVWLLRLDESRWIRRLAQVAHK
jgi:putative peptidoglycan lipid II flippase